MPKTLTAPRAAGFAFAAALPWLAYGAPPTAARLDFVSGTVEALQTDGGRRKLVKGATISSGERVLTNDGQAQLRFTDGALVSLKPGSDFVVNEYRFNGQADGQERGFFSLLKGGMRTISGLIGRQDREKYRVRTLTATIGIRGTEYSVTYGNSINVNTAEGIVEVCNVGGCLLLYPGDEAYVADEKAEPVLVQSGQERPKKDDSPPAPSSFDAPANDRDSSGSSTAVGAAVVPQDRLVFGLVDTGFNINSDLSVTPIRLSGSAGGSANLLAGQGLQTFTTQAGGEFIPEGSSLVEGGSVSGIMTWGQWITDTSINDPLIRTPAQNSFGDAIFHYVVGRPTADEAATLPSATYSLLGGSFSVSDQVSNVAGTLSSGSLDVTFSTLKVNNLQLGFNAANLNTSYQISASDLPISTSGGLTFTGSGTVQSGPSVPLTCTGCSAASLNGTFFGAGASHAGVGFSFRDASVNGDFAGAAAFSKNTAAASPQ